MGVTKVNRKDLAVLLKHKNTSKVRTAISRGSLIESKNGFIDLHGNENRKWIENQIKIARQNGLVVDIDLGAEKPNEDLDNKRNETPAKIIFGSSVDIELKKARTKLVNEQTISKRSNK